MNLWHHHPAVRSGDQLTRGERAADRMKAMLATWTALFGMAAFIAVWMFVNSSLSGVHRFDPYPWILLNLCLSTLAGLQCFVLLIANKRGEEIAAQLALHDHQLMTEMRRLVTCLHAAPETGPCTCQEPGQ